MVVDIKKQKQKWDGNQKRKEWKEERKNVKEIENN